MPRPALTATDARRLAEVAVLLAAYPVVARTRSVPGLVRFFDTARRGPAPDPERVRWLVDAVLGRLLRRDYCLPRSLLLFRFFRRGGLDARLRVGVARPAGVLKSHAWVELGGVPFGEHTAPEASFRALFTYPS